MLNKLLTKTLLFSFNIFHKGKFFHLKSEVEKANESNNPFNNEKLVTYLLRWDYDPDIKKAPITTKNHIRKYVHSLNSKDVYKYFYTGGSTGEPLKLPYSKIRTLLRTASILYYNRLGGYKEGDSYLFIRSKPKSRIFQFLRNETLFVPNDLSKHNIEKLASTLVAKKVKVIIGYPSVIYELAVFLSQNTSLRNKIFIKAFISNSEPFDEERRDFIQSVLSCKMIDRYSNEENGVIAQQREYDGEYIVDRFNLYVEIVDPVTLQPVAENEYGKVLVTDIFSDLVPMIRYDTGDYAVAAKYKDGQLWSIRKIMGRVVDNFYTTAGIPFSPLMLGPYIRLPLTDLSLQIQFQLSQLSMKSFKLQIKSPEDLIPKSTMNKVIVGLKTVIGEDAVIDVVFVKDIVAQASGKRPLYRNEMIK